MLPKTSLELMKSRYTAYKLHIAKYIIETTHKKNKDFTADIKIWEDDILQFCKKCNFEQLTIGEFIDGDFESFVTFTAQIKCENNDNSFSEKSRFIKESNRWYYADGKFLDNL